MCSSAEALVLLDHHPLIASVEEVLVRAFDSLLEELLRPNLFVKANDNEFLVSLEIEKTDQLAGMKVDGVPPIFISLAFRHVDVHQAI
jgi:hypothetical protein